MQTDLEREIYREREMMKKWIMDGRVGLGMVVVQAITTGLQLLGRVILSEGSFVFAFMAYRHVVAAFTLLPFTLYFERGAVKKLSIAAFFWLFMAALTGISMTLGLFYYGLKDTTATYASNFLNLIPLITFLFSTILRIEALGFHSRAGKLKTLGAMLCLAGTLSIALYKGNSFHLTHYRNHQHQIIIKTNKNKTRGTMFLVGSCLSAGTWFILQVKLFKVFPHKYWATLVTCILASFQAIIIGVCIDRKPSAWRLASNLELLTIFYSGIFATAASFCLISWTITVKGPTYPSMFNPLSLILITIAEAVFLGEDISLGSLIGMGLIIVGLYSFLWGKSKDTKPTLLPLKESGGAGGGDAAPESASSATIVPAASPN
ncbi:WAT1-related protein At1g43650-like [Sesamum indicum]|uniref:WAT1-related protein n=1 Tax=Sesamum indicum TaxID=4182 RepID=A0A8M8UZ71_SESIN|nr:WAT1-related protein At1g43650-like [Sesamum indicum]